MKIGTVSAPGGWRRWSGEIMRKNSSLIREEKTKKRTEKQKKNADDKCRKKKLFQFHKNKNNYAFLLLYYPPPPSNSTKWTTLSQKWWHTAQPTRRRSIINWKMAIANCCWKANHRRGGGRGQKTGRGKTKRGTEWMDRGINLNVLFKSESSQGPFLIYLNLYNYEVSPSSFGILTII